MSQPRQETGGAARTPRAEIVPAVSAARRERVGAEPVLLLDLSGSMDWDITSDTDAWPHSPSRRSLVIEALPLLVKSLEDADAEAETEQKGGDDEKGGLLTFGFSDHATEIGDLNSSNLQRRLNSIKWGGSTYIMPAWSLALKDYDDEFGDREPGQMPVHLVLVLTDGQAHDFHEFDKVIATASQRRVFVIGIVGHGDAALDTFNDYKAAAAAVNQKTGHDVAHVVLWDSVTDPMEIGEDLVTMAS